MPLADRILQVFLSGLSIGCIYAMMGLSLVLVFKSTRISDFSQGIWVCLGGMVAATLFQHHVPLGLCIVISVVFNAVVGGACWLVFIYGPWKKGVPGFQLIMLTVGVSMIVGSVGQMSMGTSPLGLPPFIAIEPINVAGAVIAPQVPWIWAVALLSLLGLIYLFNGTFFGKKLRACHQRHMGARLIGLNPPVLATMIYVLAVGLAALAGVTMTPQTTMVINRGTFLVLIGMMVYLVGGATSLGGSVIAGLAFGIIESFAGSFVSTHFMDIFPLSLMVICLLIRPAGIFGEKEPGE